MRVPGELRIALQAPETGPLRLEAVLSGKGGLEVWAEGRLLARAAVLRRRRLVLPVETQDGRVRVRLIAPAPLRLERIRLLPHLRAEARLRGLSRLLDREGVEIRGAGG